MKILPSAVVGIPVAVAAAPMIASYVLFPFASLASGLMPEFSSEMAGVVTGETIPRAIPGAIAETEGMHLLELNQRPFLYLHLFLKTLRLYYIISHL
jgi:hypothetical protein